MMTQDEFLERLWKEVIRVGANGKWIDAIIDGSAKSTIDGERRMGALLKGLLDKGVSREEIVELLEYDRRDSVFTLIHMIEEDGVEEEAWDGIHEAFDMADPGPDDEFEETAAPAAAAKSASGKRGKGAKGLAAPNAPLLKLRQSHHVAFAPDGGRVATATGGKIWEIATGNDLARCELPPHTSSVAWSPHGTVIAMKSTSGAIRLCDAKTGKKVAQVKMTGEGSAMDFSPDGKILAAGDWRGHLFAWSPADGKLLGKCEFAGEMIHDVRVSADEIAFIGREDAVGMDHALKTERWRARFGDVDHACLHVAGGARWLIGWDGDQFVKLALDTGKPIAAVKLTVAEKSYAKVGTVSPDGRYVCAIYGNDFILLDDSLRELGRHRIEYANAATFSPDSRLIALASWGKGEIWRVDAFPKVLVDKPT